VRPGHVFYDRLPKLLGDAGFDAFVEEICKRYYAPKMGALSLAAVPLFPHTRDRVF
jgi:transposase